MSLAPLKADLRAQLRALGVTPEASWSKVRLQVELARIRSAPKTAPPTSERPRLSPGPACPECSSFDTRVYKSRVVMTHPSVIHRSARLKVIRFRYYRCDATGCGRTFRIGSSDHF